MLCIIYAYTMFDTYIPHSVKWRKKRIYCWNFWSIYWIIRFQLIQSHKLMVVISLWLFLLLYSSILFHSYVCFVNAKITKCKQQMMEIFIDDLVCRWTDITNWLTSEQMYCQTKYHHKFMHHHSTNTNTNIHTHIVHTHRDL